MRMGVGLGEGRRVVRVVVRVGLGLDWERRGREMLREWEVEGAWWRDVLLEEEIQEGVMSGVRGGRSERRGGGVRDCGGGLGSIGN